jgi:hypothetical protein
MTIVRAAKPLPAASAVAADDLEPLFRGEKAEVGREVVVLVGIAHGRNLVVDGSTGTAVKEAAMLKLRDLERPMAREIDGVHGLPVGLRLKKPVEKPAAASRCPVGSHEGLAGDGAAAGSQKVLDSGMGRVDARGWRVGGVFEPDADQLLDGGVGGFAGQLCVAEDLFVDDGWVLEGSTGFAGSWLAHHVGTSFERNAAMARRTTEARVEKAEAATASRPSIIEMGIETPRKTLRICDSSVKRFCNKSRRNGTATHPESQAVFVASTKCLSIVHGTSSMVKLYSYRRIKLTDVCEDGISLADLGGNQRFSEVVERVGLAKGGQIGV